MPRKHSKCPICGANGKLSVMDNTDRLARKNKTQFFAKEYRVYCKNNGTHIVCGGGYYGSKEEAWQDWERRVKDLRQRDPNNPDEARRKYIMLVKLRDKKIAEIYEQFQPGLDKCEKIFRSGEHEQTE